MGKMDESRQRETNLLQRGLRFLGNFSKCPKTDDLFENKQQQWRSSYDLMIVSGTIVS
jgi:hypothetical protein